MKKGKTTKRSFAFRLIELFSTNRYSSYVNGDLVEMYEYIYSSKGRFRSFIWLYKQVLKSIPLFFYNSIIWSITMLKNYLKITFRNMIKQKGYSFINILGLAAGLACCIFILLYVQFEFSYDNYHDDADRIFRVAKSVRNESRYDKMAAVEMMIAPTLRENFPQVEYAARISFSRDQVVRYKDKIFKEEEGNLRHVDPEILKIFKIPFIEGNPETALERPRTMVLTDEKSKKYFGDENPIGRSILVDTTSYEITGIVENPPGNTIFKYNFLMSYESIKNQEYLKMGWQSPANMPTFIKLAGGVNPEELAKQLTQIVRENISEFLERDGVEYNNFLQPLQDIHLNSNMIWELDQSGNILYLYIFSGIGIFILLIASMNFVNLSTARSANRAKEVGMRKVAGANRRQIIWQFLNESVITSILAMIAALIIVFFLLPFFNDLTNIKFSLVTIFEIDNILVLLGLVIIIGLFAGIYPALFLSAFKPISTLKGILGIGTKGGLLRKVLVVGQFSISISLIIGTLIFYQQLQYMKNQPLGFDKEQKLIINMEGNRVSPNSYQSVKSEFLKIPSVLGASFSSSVPGKWRYRWRQYPTGERATNLHAIRCMQVDYDFFELYDLQLISGRQFNPDMSLIGYIFNETAVRKFGWESPEAALSKTLRDVQTPIIGVIKDYHFAGLQQQIEPLGIFLMSEDYRYLTLKIDMKDTKNTIASIENKYRELFPNTVFDYFFLDTDFNSQYLKEDLLGRIFSIFTFFGIFIACLGLFGLAAFMAEQRTKEIGIRKVMGASVSRIILMLSGEFTKWIIAANIIAWPISWYLISKWIISFAYRIDIPIITFLFAGLLTLVISAFTVSYQSIKAAYANPVDSLRDE